VAHKVLGQIAYAQNDLPAAEKSFKMVLLLDPRDQEAREFVASVGGVPAAQAPAAPPPPPVRPVQQQQQAPPAPQPIPVVPPVPPAPPTPIPITTPAMPPPTPPAMRQPEAAAGRPPVVSAVTPPPAPPPFEEIQPLEDLDLSAGEFLLDEPPAVSARSVPEIPAAPSPMEFPIESPLDLAEPEPWLPVPEPPPPLPAAAEPSPPPPLVAAAPEPPPLTGDEGMELEVFARVPWGGGEARVAPPEPSPPPPPAVPAATQPATARQESPFEVFGRPMQAGPPQSTKGERPAFEEIEIEHTAYAPVSAEPQSTGEPVFQMFTREPDQRTAAPPARAGRGEGAGPREIDIETTSFTPPESYVPEAAGPPEPSLEIEPTAFAQPEPFAHAAAEEKVLSLDEEIPRIDLAQEVSDEQIEDESDESVAAAAPVGSAAERGVFDTETLAGIYVNQGFFGRAADIYRRLIAQRPDDGGLRDRLERVLAREREQSGPGETVAAAVAEAAATPAATPVAAVAPTPAAAGAAAEDPRIRQLHTLLEAFKGGRPR
jgi:hypothetical protein